MTTTGINLDLEEFPITIIRHYQNGKYTVTAARKETGSDGQRRYVIQYAQIGLRWLATWAQEGVLWLPRIKCLGSVSTKSQLK